MKNFKKILCITSSWIISTVLQAREKPNILFIIVDDLRPELGCYDSPQVQTPNIDQLAQSGTLFANAYCNVPVSGASRASLLTGIYPNFQLKRFVDAETYAQKDTPLATPLPLTFKNYGYYTISNGKVFHHATDFTRCWNETPWIVSPASGDWAVYNKWNVWKDVQSEKELNPKTHRGPYCEAANAPDSIYEDYQIAKKTIADLQRLKKNNQPFFLAVGFRRPHLPFVAPKKYWDLYKREDIKMADNRFRSEKLPKQVQSSREIFQYTHTDNVQSDSFHREARHAYYACVSFIDAQIGLLLDELEKLHLSENTVVVLVGDHGWHLGEHGFWGKHTLMNNSTRAPMIVRVPGQKTGIAQGIVEFVDIYPFLCDVCNVTAPTGIQGTSFLPMIKNPQKRIKPCAFIQWGKGINVVNEQYSYAQWMDKDQHVIGEMLFDHHTDEKENQNVIGKTKYQKQIEYFKSQLNYFKTNVLK